MADMALNGGLPRCRTFHHDLISIAADFGRQGPDLCPAPGGAGAVLPE
ncbi:MULTISPECIES: hypothetical protein [Rhizobium]|nr:MULTISPECIES: hypothetical protein [Rhizobium]NZD49094.1 hypothetical protein [Rhizobium leguminosarum]QJX03662.1 hypothetical protein RLCC275e_01260 [Rhizobium brockwellii]QND15636.1 hypothetical protein HB775_18395 [Rhizobium leguminosarum bv. trifolii]